LIVLVVDYVAGVLHRGSVDVDRVLHQNRL
jgi:hypothetical protein